MKSKIQLVTMLLLVVCLTQACNKKKCDAKDPSACICMAVYQPVCGCNGITYSNACEADCAEVDIESQGPC